MGRWTYYSPLGLGFLLVRVLNAPIRASLATRGAGVQWSVVFGAAILVALHCQVLMIGAQGAFAQTLPVPRDRTIRGRSAAQAGWLLITWVTCSSVTALLASQEVTTAAIAIGVISLAALAGALILYVWSLPTADDEFREERHGARSAAR